MRIARARRKGGKEKKAPSFYIGYFGDSFLANVFKLHLQSKSKSKSKSNFAHKVEPKLNILRLLLLFHV